MTQLIEIVRGETRIETPDSAIALDFLARITGQARAVVTAPALLTSTIAPPALGKSWPEQGGIFVGTVRGENGNDWHLIASANPAAHTRDITWGAAGEDEKAANDRRDGLANARVLQASKHDHPAAQWAADLNIDGHSDWYLPARHEAQLCYLNAPELFETAGWYWTSTQYGPGNAWGQDFDDGLQDVDRKSLDRKAFAVRRVPVSTLAL